MVIYRTRKLGNASTRTRKIYKYSIYGAVQCRAAVVWLVYDWKVRMEMKTTWKRAENRGWMGMNLSNKWLYYLAQLSFTQKRESQSMLSAKEIGSRS